MIIIFLGLLLIMIFAYLINKRDIISPAVLFSFSFFFSSCWALAYAPKWNLKPSLTTMLVILLGTFEFVFITFVIRYISDNVSNDLNNDNSKSASLIWKNIELKKSISIIFLELIAVYYRIAEIKKATGNSNLREATIIIRDAQLFGTGNPIVLPKMVAIAGTFTLALGFFYGYILIKKRILKHKIDFPSVIIFAISAYSSTLSGGRSSMLVLFTSLIVYYFILMRLKNSNKKLGISFKNLIFGGSIGVAFLAIFQQLQFFLGRGSTATNQRSWVYNLAIYIGAEIKNLDLFISEKQFPITKNLENSQTLFWLGNFWGKHVSKNGGNHLLDLPFRSVNGLYIGNVYTQYYQFLYDLGFFGVFIFVLIMAILAQLTYKKATNYLDNGRVPLSIVVYGYMTNTLLLSFFSNRFYETFFNLDFIVLVIFVVLLNIFNFGFRSNK